MAPKTTAKKAAEAAKDTTETPVTQPDAPTQDAAAQAPAPGSVAQGQGDQDQPAEDIPSVFDQAVQFCLKGHLSGHTAPDARELWDALGCDEMPAKLAVAVFDCALDQGQPVAERLLGKITVPLVGPDEEIADEAVDAVVTDFLAWRLRRYAFTGNAGTKMREWSIALLQLHTFILTGLKA